MAKNNTLDKNHINPPDDCCQTVFKKGNTYITAHLYESNGGFWKMANSIKNLASKKTRLGTYDKFLNKIGD